MTLLHAPPQPHQRFALFNAMADDLCAAARLEIDRTGKSYADVRDVIFANSTAGPMLRRAVDSRFGFVNTVPA